MFKSFEDLQKFSAEQIEAATQSVTILAQGVQQVFSETTALSRQTVETGSDAFQNLLGSRSFDRAVKVQIDYARSAYTTMASGSSKIGGIVTATAQDMVKPLEGAFARMQGAPRG